MNIVDTLASRIRAKITPEISEQLASRRSEPASFDIHDSMWAFSHRAAAAKASEATIELETAAPRM